MSTSFRIGLTSKGGVTRGTGDRLTLAVGSLALIGFAVLAYLSLKVTPPDVVQGQLVRNIYIHPALATMCYVALGFAALGSVLYLWPRSRHKRWDQLAGASAEVGVVFCAMTLITGSVWGRASWGVWWTWDARLTLTALLMAAFLGYLALRRTGGEPHARAMRNAVGCISCFLIVPIDHYATNWWVTLHQGDTVFKIDPTIHGSQLVAMMLSFVVFGLILAWMMIHRFRVERLEDRFETEGLTAAVVSRRAEAGASASPAADKVPVVSGEEGR